MVVVVVVVIVVVVVYYWCRIIEGGGSDRFLNGVSGNYCGSAIVKVVMLLLVTAFYMGGS